MLTRIKGEINRNTIIVGDFNTSVTPMDRSTKQKISKETQALNDAMDQLDLIDIDRAFHPKLMDFTFFLKWAAVYEVTQSRTRMKQHSSSSSTQNIHSSA